MNLSRSGFVYDTLARASGGFETAMKCLEEGNVEATKHDHVIMGCS